MRKPWQLSPGGGYLVHPDGTVVSAMDIWQHITEMEAEAERLRAVVVDIRKTIRRHGNALLREAAELDKQDEQ